MFGVVANVESDRILRTGAKVWVLQCNGDAAHPYVVGLSKGGRKVFKYSHFKRLTNYRAAWIPEHLRGDVTRKWTDKADAERAAAYLSAVWSGVRYFLRDSETPIKDGITEQDAFRRAVAIHQAASN